MKELPIYLLLGSMTDCAMGRQLISAFNFCSKNFCLNCSLNSSLLLSLSAIVLVHIILWLPHHHLLLQLFPLVRRTAPMLTRATLIRVVTLVVGLEDTILQFAGHARSLQFLLALVVLQDIMRLHRLIQLLCVHLVLEGYLVGH